MVGDVTVRHLAAWALLLAAAACGGGGGGGGSGSSTPSTPAPAVSFTGTVAPLSFVSNAPTILLVGVLGGATPTNMLLPPSAPQIDFPTIAQAAQYTVNTSALPAVKLSAVSFLAPDIGAYVVPIIGATGYAADPTIGQLIGINVLTVDGTTINANTGTLQIDSSGSQPSAVLTINGSASAGYALPHSAALNPGGFTYQTFGGWSVVSSSTMLIDGFFSMGVPTTGGIPVAGTASYSGQGDATFVDATTGNLFDVITTVTATVNFATRAITFTTAASSTVPTGSAAGTARTPNPALNLSGTLTYPVATNTSVGPATASNTMTGNVTGRFYGTPLAAATGTKVVGSPPEFGGTFAVFLPGVGSLQGSFGAQ